MQMRDHETNAAVPDEWRRWVAENRMRTNDEEYLVKTLVQNGVTEQAAREEVKGVISHPYFQAGAKMAQQLSKLESLLGVYQALSAQSSRAESIERKSTISREEFLENYYSANRPLVLTDIMHDWKALSLWRPEYFKSVCGEAMVEVMTGREGDPRYDINADQHRTSVRFADYIEMVMRDGQSNDYYLVANNHFWEKPGISRLAEDIVIFPEYLENRGPTNGAALWFGPAGTITQLHHDAINILLAQVYGRKRITLFSPNQTPLFYNEVGVYSEVDLEHPDYEEHPLFKEARPIQLILNPGEVLFLPVGWWHHVKALEVSITVSFINFLFPNEFHWKNPRRMLKRFSKTRTA